MKFAVALIAGLAVAGAAQAQHGHGAHAGHTAPAAAAPVEGQGVVKAVDGKAGKITIAHGPIKALNWGAMTMAFKADAAVLKGVAAGDKIAFTLKGQQVMAIRKQ